MEMMNKVTSTIIYKIFFQCAEAIKKDKLIHRESTFRTGIQ